MTDGEFSPAAVQERIGLEIAVCRRCERLRLAGKEGRVFLAASLDLGLEDPVLRRGTPLIRAAATVYQEDAYRERIPDWSSYVLEVDLVVVADSEPLKPSCRFEVQGYALDRDGDALPALRRAALALGRGEFVVAGGRRFGVDRAICLAGIVVG